MAKKGKSKGKGAVSSLFASIPLVGKAKKAAKAVKKKVAKAKKKGKKAKRKLRRKIGKVFTKARKLKNNLSKKKLVKKVKKAAKKAVLTMKKVVNQAKATVAKAKQQVKAAVKQVKQQVKTVVQQTKQQVKTTVQQVKQQVKTTVQQVKQQVKTTVQQTKQQVKNAVKQVKQQAKTLVQQTKQAVKEKIVAPVKKALQPKASTNNAKTSTTGNKKISSEAEVKALLDKYKQTRVLDSNGEPLTTLADKRRVLSAESTATPDGLFPYLQLGTQMTYSMFVEDYLTLSDPKASIGEQFDAALSLINPVGKAKKGKEALESLDNWEKGIETVYNAANSSKKVQDAQTTQKELDQLGEYAKKLDKGTGNVISNGKVTVKSIESNPSAFSGKSVNEIARILKSEGYDVTIKASKKSRSGAQIIQINNHGNGRNITQVQVSPGGGRHGANPYVKISTSDEGIIKVVDGKKDTYKTDGKETANIIFTER